MQVRHFSYMFILQRKRRRLNIKVLEKEGFMLTIENISAGYAGVNVIEDISFKLEKGENICIIGPNGCGKTTLLKAISKLIPFDGEVFIGKYSIKKMKRHEIAKHIAMMSQIGGIYFTYSIYDTVMLGRYVHMNKGVFKTPSKKDRDAVEKSLVAVGLKDEMGKQISTLSGGQLQRVFLAQTLAQEPEIILLDEPTNHLDLKYQVELIKYLKNWSQEKGRSVIGVLHDINLAMTLSDNIIAMKDGKIIGRFDSKNKISGETLDYVYGMGVYDYMKESLGKWEDIPYRAGEHSSPLRL